MVCRYNRYGLHSITQLKREEVNCKTERTNETESCGLICPLLQLSIAFTLKYRAETARFRNSREEKPQKQRK